MWNPLARRRTRGERTLPWGRETTTLDQSHLLGYALGRSTVFPPPTFSKHLYHPRHLPVALHIPCPPHPFLKTYTSRLVVVVGAGAPQGHRRIDFDCRTRGVQRASTCLRECGNKPSFRHHALWPKAIIASSSLSASAPYPFLHKISPCCPYACPSPPRNNTHNLMCREGRRGGGGTSPKLDCSRALSIDGSTLED